MSKRVLLACGSAVCAALALFGARSPEPDSHAFNEAEAAPLERARSLPCASAVANSAAVRRAFNASWPRRDALDAPDTRAPRDERRADPSAPLHPDFPGPYPDRQSFEADLHRKGVTRVAADAPPPPAFAASATRDALQKTWDAESSQPGASARLRQYYEGALSDLELTGRIDALECRSTLCRVKMSFGDPHDALAFEADASKKEQRKHIDYQFADGGVSVEAFLARE